MKVLGIIPARGGSKGVPRKNIRLLCGKPLLVYSAEAALKARSLSRIVLSTDDEEIAEIGKQSGLDVPFLRPLELAGDNVPMLPVLQHVVRFMEGRGEDYEAICLLQPTNPLRKAEDIDACVMLLEERKVDSVVSILPVPTEFNPHWVYFQSEDGLIHLSLGGQDPIPRRQDLPAAFYREGSLYTTRRETLMERNSLYGSRTLGYLMDPEGSVNINSLEDWRRAEKLLTQNLKKPSIGKSLQ